MAAASFVVAFSLTAVRDQWDPARKGDGRNWHRVDRRRWHLKRYGRAESSTMSYLVAGFPGDLRRVKSEVRRDAPMMALAVDSKRR